MDFSQGFKYRKTSLMKSSTRNTGYVTDTQRGYESGSTEMEMEDEPSAYYMTGWAKNLSSLKKKMGIKIKEKLVRI